MGKMFLKAYEWLVKKPLISVLSEKTKYHQDDGFGQVSAESRHIYYQKAANIGCDDDRERWVSSM